MSTTNLLNSAINKLTQRLDTAKPLVFNSDQALKQQLVLKKRIRDFSIPETSFVAVGAFLQNVDITIFTDDELKVLLLFDYSSIDSKNLIRNYHPTINKTPYYDINKRIINMKPKNINTINSTFKKLHSINKNLSIEYFISYILTQI